MKTTEWYLFFINQVSNYENISSNLKQNNGYLY